MTRSEAVKWLERIEERYILCGDEGFDKARKEALHMAIEILEYLDNIEAYMHDFDVTAEEATKAIERKKGEWTYLYDGNYKCSECGSWWACTDSQINEMHYCPCCGAKMDERREDDKGRSD